jgi:hypothetical protein
MSIDEAKKMFKVEGNDKISTRELRRRFRAKCYETHTDAGGTVEAFDALKDAYTILQKSDCIEGVERAATTLLDGVTPLSTLGQGYPLIEPAKTCEQCDGAGYKEYTISTRTKKIDCPECQGTGVFSYPCKRCGGSGRYKHPVSKVDIGECRACKGSGRFYPENKRQKFRVEYAFVPYIPGTKMKGYECKNCAGSGYQMVPSDEQTVGYICCDGCKGVGEVKMWNPVIPRGFFKA